jgi:protoporphyrinogen/coproporphyrinogen III oxidase
VVGGGIAGLAAAHRLRELDPELEILVLERADGLGGKIQTQPFAGQPVETGAESLLMREAGGESAALALARRLGLGDALVHPSPVPAALAIDGALHPIPGGTLMGIPADPARIGDIAGVTNTDTDEGRPLLAGGEDVAVGALVRSRLGDEVVRRLVDPLLGGVYAGRADELSLQATIPGLHRTAQASHTLTEAVAGAMRAAPRPAGTPVFASVQGGLSRLVTAVAAASRADVRLGQTVRALDRTAKSWRVTVGPTVSPSYLEAEAVVLAVPAAPAARLLPGIDAEAADAVGQLAYASVALVTLALPAGTVLPPLSGFLVPAGEGFAVKAATFVTTKWPELAGEAVVIRASLGRHGESDALHLTDEALVELVRDELGRIAGGALPAPMAARVNRWGGALPQYGVGHVTRIAAVRSGLPSSLALAGAAVDGVGIAACVRSGEAAAEQVWHAIHGQPVPAQVGG